VRKPNEPRPGHAFHLVFSIQYPVSSISHLVSRIWRMQATPVVTATLGYQLIRLWPVSVNP